MTENGKIKVYFLGNFRLKQKKDALRKKRFIPRES